MKIYQAEIEAGLQEVMSANASITFDAPIFPAHKKHDIALADEVNKKLADGQFDLYYFDSILVSTGWNGNDDVFDKGQVWAARNTPVHKMVNWNHDHKHIIGHIVCSQAIDSEGKVLDEDTKSDDLPDSFDILVGSVIYKCIRDEEKQEYVNQLIDEIPKGEWFVSMECLFADFDYAVIGPNEERGIINRTQATAFLTKHLRAFGGKGEYNGYKVGRLVKDFAFSGKGMTQKPANKKSVIFANSVPFNAQANIEIQEKQGEIMDTVSKQEHDNVLARLAKAEAKVTELELNVTQAKAELDKSVAEVAKLAAEATQLKTDLSAKAAIVTERDSVIAKDVEAKKEVDEKLKVITAELEAVKLERVKAERKSQLVSAGVKEDEAAVVVDKWVSASDEQFADIVKLHAVSKEEKLPVEVDSAEASTKDEQVLETKVTEPKLGVTEDKSGESVAKVAQWVKASLHTTKGLK